MLEHDEVVSLFLLFLDVEVCVHVLRTFEDTELHLHLGYAQMLIEVIVNRRETNHKVFAEVLCLRHPPIAVAYDADKEWNGVLDFPEAYVHHLAGLGLLFGNAPAKVKFCKCDIPL